MMLGQAHGHPRAHRIAEHRCLGLAPVFLAQGVDHRRQVAGPLVLGVEGRIGRLVAEAVAQRVDAGDAMAAGFRASTIAVGPPALGVHEQPVLQHHQRPLALDGVVDALAAMGDVGHGELR
jgi:hypothetical protein